MSARERILQAAYELFSTRGVKGTGISAIITRAGVARMSLYQHFPSKDDLVIEFLKEREQRFNSLWQNRVRSSQIPARDRLLMIFDQMELWFNQPDFEGSSFLKILMEEQIGGPLHQAAADHIENIRSFVQELAEEAKINDAAPFAHLWLMLMHGAIVAAQAGNRNAARLAKTAGEILLRDWHGQSGSAGTG